MKYYGSLTNRLMERVAVPELRVGMGVTECLWSDRHAYEIVAVTDERHITIRRMHAELKAGTHWLDQEYDLTSDESQPQIHLFLTKTKGWRERIGRNGVGDTPFAVGYASEYYDPSF